MREEFNAYTASKGNKKSRLSYLSVHAYLVLLLLLLLVPPAASSTNSPFASFYLPLVWFGCQGGRKAQEDN